MMIENLNELIKDKYGYYSEEDLKKNWINTDKLEDITIQLARQAMYDADRIYNQDKQLQQANEDIKQYSDWLDEAREDVEKAKKYNYDAVQQLKESNKTLNEMLLILNNRLDEYKRVYGEL